MSRLRASDGRRALGFLARQGMGPAALRSGRPGRWPSAGLMSGSRAIEAAPGSSKDSRDRADDHFSMGRPATSVMRSNDARFVV